MYADDLGVSRGGGFGTPKMVGTAVIISELVLIFRATDIWIKAANINSQNFPFYSSSNGRLGQTGEHAVAVVKSAHDERCDETRGHLWAENVPDLLQSTQVKVADTSYLTDVGLHRQFTV